MNEEILNKITFHQVKKQDIHHVAKLSRMLCTEEIQYDNTIDINWNIQQYLNNIIEYDNTFIELIKLDNKNIGYFVAHIEQTEEFRIKQNILWLDELFILTEYRNNKIGNKIMSKLIDLSKIIKNLLAVKIIAKNKKALSFYKNLGFQEYEIILELNSSSIKN